MRFTIAGVQGANIVQQKKEYAADYLFWKNWSNLFGL